MSTLHVVVRKALVWGEPMQVLGTFRDHEDAKSLLNHISDQIDHFYKMHERYLDTCKFLGESWFRASGLRDRRYSIDEILEGGAEVGYHLSQIIHYSNAVKTERCVYIDDLKRAIVTLRALFRVAAPPPDWPIEPTQGLYEGSKNDYTILTLEVPS